MPRRLPRRGGKMDDRLSDRKKKVLGALVDSYITDAEPISSSAIKNKYMPDVSSATIRSELATLEELGYLVQPHVSSGRVPSAKAYRFYVDCLLSECGDVDVDGLDETLKRRMSSVEELVRETMKKAKRLGLKVALDLANYNIVNAYKGLLEEVIPQYVDILFANASEAEAFTGLPAQEAVKALEKQVDVALVTLGKEGSLIGSHGQFYHVDAEGGKPVDTTGAGDNFAAGFLYGQSVGASLVQSAQIGSMLSGYVIDVVGPQVPADKWEQIKLKVKAILAGTKD